MASGEETGHTVWLRLDTGGGGCQVFGGSLETHPQSLSQFKPVMGPAGLGGQRIRNMVRARLACEPKLWVPGVDS